MTPPGLPLIIITGPTAAGKTSLAIALCQRFGGSVINADSRQIYRGMDIGTGKPTMDERQGIAHYLMDICSPDERYSAARFQQDADALIASQPGPWFVVGGTNLYLRALLRGIFEQDCTAAEAVRARINQVLSAADAGYGHRWLTQVDPDLASRLHPNDTVRIERGLEVYFTTGKPLSKHQTEHGFAVYRYPQHLFLGLIPDKSLLKQAISERVEEMFQRGLAAETQALLTAGYAQSLPALRTIGYAQCVDMLQGRCSQAQAKEDIRAKTWQYAKRQLTWLQKEQGLLRLSPLERENAVRLVDQVLQPAKVNSSSSG